MLKQKALNCVEHSKIRTKILNFMKSGNKKKHRKNIEIEENGA